MQNVSKRNRVAVMVAALGVIGGLGIGQASGALVVWQSTALSTNLWSDGNNWIGGVAPVAGDEVRITLPVTGGSRATNNDLPAGTSITGITLTHNLNTIAGNSILLNGNIASIQGGSNATTISAPIVLGQDVSIDVSANTSSGRLEMNGTITGAFGITKTGAGRLRLVSPAKAYTGSTIITGGLLDVSAENVLPFGASAGNMFVGSGGNFRINNVNIQINGLNDFAGGAGSVTKDGANSRSLTLGNGDANGSFSGSINMTGTGGGGSTVNKVGLGTQTLSGAVVTPGAGSVTGGRLNVNGTWNNGVSVGANGTLGGTGSIAGAVSGAGTVSPGVTIGSLTVGSATLSGTLAIEADGTGAGSADRLNVTGALNITAATLNLSVLSTLNDPSYIIATYGSLSGTFAGVAGLPANYEVQYAFGGNNVALVLIPEPATLGLLASVGLIALRRR